MAFFSRCDNPSRFATDLVKLATRSKRTSTRASSKSDEKVQAASLQKGRKRMAALQLLAPLARPRSQLKATPRLRANYVIAPVVGKKIRSRANRTPTRARPEHGLNAERVQTQSGDFADPLADCCGSLNALD